LSSLSNNQSYEKPQQQKQRLINSQLTSTNSSSSSNSASVASSPPQQRQSELNNLHKISGDFSKDLRKTSKTSLKEIEELKEIKQEIKINSSKSFSPFPEYYFEDSSTQNIKVFFLNLKNIFLGSFWLQTIHLLDFQKVGDRVCPLFPVKIRYLFYLIYT